MSDNSAVTITTGNLAQALAAVAPFASRDVTLPALTAVQIHCGNGVFTATATDRYVVGHARVASKGALARPRYLYRRDAKALRNELAAYMDNRESGTDPVTITEQDDYLLVTFGTVRMCFVQPEGVNHFPNVEKILAELPTADAEGLHAPVGLTHRVLRPLLKAATCDIYNAPRWTFNGPRKPVRVEIGDWFIAALMPASLRGDEQPVSVEMPAMAEAVAQ